MGTDIWTAIAYALQPAESKLMGRDPRHPQLEKLVNWRVLVYSYLYIGQMQMFFCWLMFFLPAVSPGIWSLYRNPLIMDYSGKKYFAELSTGKTVYYWTLVMGQIAAAISTTTKLQSVFGFGSKPYGFPNVTLNVMFILEVALGLAAIFFPVMNGWFDTYPLSAQSVLIPAVALVGICLIEEIRK